MKFYSTPQQIGRVRIVDAEGNDLSLGDKIITLSAQKDSSSSFEGTLTIDVPDYPKKGQNLCIDVSLPEHLAAVGLAAINH